MSRTLGQSETGPGLHCACHHCEQLREQSGGRDPTGHQPWMLFGLMRSLGGVFSFERQSSGPSDGWFVGQNDDPCIHENFLVRVLGLQCCQVSVKAGSSRRSQWKTTGSRWNVTTEAVRASVLSAAFCRCRGLRGWTVGVGGLPLENRDECGRLFKGPANRHEVLDTALVHDLPDTRWRRHDDQGAVVLTEQTEGLNENTEAQSVDPGDPLKVHHDGPGLLTQVIESLPKRRRRGGAQLPDQGH